ncbi:MAG: hypothetical protein RB289_05130 [Paludibacter sp.]|nr:hypothetical protein [Paludibacter sp.]
MWQNAHAKRRGLLTYQLRGLPLTKVVCIIDSHVPTLFASLKYKFRLNNI